MHKTPDRLRRHERQTPTASLLLAVHPIDTSEPGWPIGQARGLLDLRRLDDTSTSTALLPRPARGCVMIAAAI